MFEKAIGGTVLWVGECDGNVIIHTDKGNLILEPERVIADGNRCSGSCCSQSWIDCYDIEPGFLDSKLLSLDIGPEHYDSDDDSIKICFVTIKTELARMTVEYRNCSNGYFDGSINFIWKEEENV